MCHISHNKYKKDKNAGRNETGYSEETINKYNNYTLQDLQDIELLQTQWKAQLILVLGYLLEYRIKRRNEIFQAGQYGDKEESELINEVADEFEDMGINVDATAVLAAQLELFGQTILTPIYWTKYQRLPHNLDTEDFLVTKSANKEIFIGAVLEEIAYIFNLIGTTALYRENSTGNTNNVDD